MIDLRDHLEALDRHGELLTVDKKMDPNLEVAAYAAMSNRAGAQAVHFKSIAGCLKDFSIAANLLSGPQLWYQFDDLRSPWGRIAIGLGLDPKIRYEELINVIIDR
ncbi:MAG TPA: hypothetical protein VJZ16_05920, partial [Syntrophales bacterium]|nr:hypothetical protein [Syntrophales bacterium]